MAGMVALWTCRLSIFLFLRVLAAGKDRRFDKIKLSFWRFFVAWSLQGFWAFVTPTPALAVILTEGDLQTNPLTWVGVGIWAFGMIIETTADIQKKRFSSDP
jgi:steroid 5-alpha reductase family enzyme